MHKGKENEETGAKKRVRTCFSMFSGTKKILEHQGGTHLSTVTDMRNGPKVKRTNRARRHRVVGGKKGREPNLLERGMNPRKGGVVTKKCLGNFSTNKKLARGKGQLRKGVRNITMKEGMGSRLPGTERASIHPTKKTQTKKKKKKTQKVWRTPRGVR